MIMKRNIKQTLLAPVVLLLAAATLGLAGCTQGDDTLPGAGGNDAARSLNINVGPKQGFTPGNADGSAPSTRATVDESTGAMDWEEGDRIFLAADYNDAARTEATYTLVRTATSTWDIYEGYLTTYDADGNPIDITAHTPVSAIKLPLDATQISALRAYHIDSSTGYIPKTGEGLEGMARITVLDGGSRDYMDFYAHSLSIDVAVTLNLTRYNLTRLHFTGGLTPGKKYYVDGASSMTEFGGGLTSRDLNVPFTAAPDGSLTLCAGIDGTAQTVTLKEKDDDDDATNDKVVYTVTSDFAYGSTYQCIIPTSGGIDPDSKPDLLLPAPIVAGNTVWKVNGYFVTAPDADESKYYKWSYSNFNNTEMENDPCVGKGNWRMPSTKDFQYMAGWQDGTANEWTQESNSDIRTVSSDADAWKAAFPSGAYWSSVPTTSLNEAWYIEVNSNIVSYKPSSKGGFLCVRCVQPQ